MSFRSLLSSRRSSRSRPAFTLVEMLIALTLFAIVSLVAVNTLITGMRASKKIQAEVFLYQEASALMDRLAQDIEGKTVDYEAYYSREVKGATGFGTPTYGQYAQSFFNPGTDGPEAGPYAGVSAWYRAWCADGTSTYPADCPEETPVYAQRDTDTGTHPFAGIETFAGYNGDPSSMNAFCESNDGSLDCETLGLGFSKELILINATGDELTIYAPELEGTDVHGLSRMVLEGEDSDSDGLVDTWQCASAYTCTLADALPDPEDLSSAFDIETPTDFIPLLPRTLDLQSFWVQITPLENPYLAFGEPESQIQPQITIILTLSLNESDRFGLLGELPSITIQRSFSSDVRTTVDSYR